MISLVLYHTIISCLWTPTLYDYVVLYCGVWNKGYTYIHTYIITGQDYRVTATAPEYDLLLAIRQRRLRYLGHILRMPESRVVRRALVALAKGGSVYPKGSLFMDCQTMKFHQLVALAQRRGAWNALATQLRWDGLPPYHWTPWVWDGTHTYTLAKSNTLINIICIQEARIRQGTDIEHLKLDGYSMITQPYTEKCSKKGGLVTYVSNNINIVNYNTFNTFTTWEGLSLDIIDNSGKQITIYAMFTDHLSTITTMLQLNHLLKTSVP